MDDNFFLFLFLVFIEVFDRHAHNTLMTRSRPSLFSSLVLRHALLLPLPSPDILMSPHTIPSSSRHPHSPPSSSPSHSLQQRPQNCVSWVANLFGNEREVPEGEERGRKMRIRIKIEKNEK